MLIVMQGEGEIGEDRGIRQLKMGSIFFLFANEKYLIRCTKERTLIIYFAYPNLKQFFQHSDMLI